MYSTIHLHYIGLQNPQGKVPKHDDSPIRGGFKLNVCGKPVTLETSANGAFVRILRMPGSKGEVGGGASTKETPPPSCVSSEGGWRRCVDREPLRLAIRAREGLVVDINNINIIQFKYMDYMSITRNPSLSGRMARNSPEILVFLVGWQGIHQDSCSSW